MRYYFSLLIFSFSLFLAASCGHSKKATTTKEATPVGKSWTVNSFDASDIRPDSKALPTMHFEEAGKLSGNTGCNNFSGSYTIQSGNLQLDPGMMTKMFCEGGVENKFLQAMKKTNRYEIKGDKLLLYDGTTLVMQLTGK